MNNNIYIDLDDTLIHAISYCSGNKREKIVVGDEKYYVFLRPWALQMLKDLRYLGSVKLFTTATREYALIMNQTFGLGFKENEILAYEDCWYQVQTAYGGTDYCCIQTRIDPNSVLIDNLPSDDNWPRRKRFVLGINEDRYFQIREFNGKDPECFAKEWQEIVINIQLLLSDMFCKIVISDRQKATSASFLEENKIAHIISLCDYDYHDEVEKFHKNVAIPANIKCYRWIFADTEDCLDKNAPKEFQITQIIQIFREIRRAHKVENILIHCRSGLCRSTAIAFIYFRMLGFDNKHALSKLLKIRNHAWPNALLLQYGDTILGFEDNNQMSPFIKEWKEKKSASKIIII